MTISTGVGEPKLITALTMSPGSNAEDHLFRPRLGFFWRQALPCSMVRQPGFDLLRQHLRSRSRNDCR